MGKKLDEMAERYQSEVAEFVGKPREQLEDLKHRYKEGMRKFLRPPRNLR